MTKKWFMLSFLIALLVISSCSSRGTYNKNPKTENFYTGSEGVRMEIENGAPPSNIYYYSNAVGTDYNDFDVSVYLRNVGASWTKGGVYVSGYDPTLIYLEGINIPKTNGGFFDNCAMNFDSFSFVDWSSISGVIGCQFSDGSGFSGTQDGVGISQLLQLFGCDDCPELNFNYNWQTGDWNVDLSQFSLDFLHHGRALLILLDKINFDRFNGKEYYLAPDNYEFPGGESTVISFPGEVRNWPAGLDHTDVSFLFSTCYAYSTYATPVVCIDPDPFSETEKACIAGSIDMSRTQGAPVAITNIGQESTPRSVIFTIEVSNVGPGKIINPLHLELCSPYYPGRLGVQDLDIVYVGDIRMSGSDQKLICSPNDNIIRLRNGKGQITCTYNMEYTTAKSAYKAPLIVELWYGYSETQRRDVRIKRAS